MGRLCAVLVLTASVLTASVATDAADAHPPAWKLFKGSMVAARYPSSWSRLNMQRQSLDILSPGQRQEGVVIGLGQAEVGISEIPADEVATRRNDLLKGDPDEQSKPTASFYDGSGSRNGCGRLEAIQGESNAGPPEHPTFEHDAFFLCMAKGRHFVTSLRYWTDDPNGPRHLATALKITRSLRVK